MKPKSIILLLGVVVFVAAIYFALMREVDREEELITSSISGIVKLSATLMASGQADVVRTDRLVLMLVEPGSEEPVAFRFESPVVPPQTISIGQAHARKGRYLSGSYYLVGFTDKDGDLYKITPGEVYGRSPEPIPLGTEEVELMLDQPNRGQAPRISSARADGAPPDIYRPHPLMATPSNPCAAAQKKMIQVIIQAKPGLEGAVGVHDRLVVKLIPPGGVSLTRVEIVKKFELPYTLWISPAGGMTGKPKAKAYIVEVFTDRDGDIDSISAEELTVRSAGPVRLGTKGLVLSLERAAN